jgi:hypothetical protein
VRRILLIALILLSLNASAVVLEDYETEGAYFTEGITEDIMVGNIYYSCGTAQTCFDLLCVANITREPDRRGDDYTLEYVNQVLTPFQDGLYVWTKPDTMREGEYLMYIKCVNSLGNSTTLGTSPFRKFTVGEPASETLEKLKDFLTLSGLFDDNSLTEMLRGEFKFQPDYMIYYQWTGWRIEQQKRMWKALVIIFKIIAITFLIITLSPIWIVLFAELYITMRAFMGSMDQSDTLGKKSNHRGFNLIMHWAELHITVYWNMLKGAMHVLKFVFDTIIDVSVQFLQLAALVLDAITPFT